MEQITKNDQAFGTGLIESAIESIEVRPGRSRRNGHARGAEGCSLAEMRIGDSLVEMGEGPGEWKAQEAGIHLYVDDCDAVYQRAIAAGAKSMYAPYDAPYGERSAYIVDPWGNRWFIGTPK